MRGISASWLRCVTLGACAMPLLGACGGLLEIDDLEFTGNGGSGGAAGSSAGNGGNAGDPSGGSAGSVAGSAGAGGSAGTRATGGSGGTGGSAGNSTGGNGGCGLGSEYDDISALGCFQQQVAGSTIDVTSNQLHITPVVNPWFGSDEGVFVYQTVGSDDFVAVSRVRVESTTNPPNVPQDAFAGGGIVMRAPTSGANVLASLTTFELDGGGTFGALGQFTLPGASISQNFRRTQGSTIEGYIALCRAGSTAFVATRLETDPNFAHVATIGPTQAQPGPDATTLTQLGSSAHIYQSSSTPDTVVWIDYLRVSLRNVADAADCASAAAALDD